MAPRRAFLLVSLCALAAIGASGVTGFAAQTGSAGAAPAAVAGARVIVLGAGVALPDGVGALPHGGSADGGGKLVGWSRPGLGVTSGVAGEVERAGDLFLVDTTSAPDAQHASLYVTNAAAVARSLRGFVLPIGLWAQAGDGTWRRAGERLVTESGGGVPLTLDPGRVYAVSLERGGSFVGSVGAPVAPAFYLAL